MQRNQWIIQAILASVGATMALSGCGGGGGGGGGDPAVDDDPPEEEEVATQDSWLFFYNTLSAIHPDAPNNRVVIDDQAATPFDDQNHAPPLALIGGQWTGSDTGLVESRVSRIIYSATTGELYQADADPDTDPSTDGRQQMSGEDIPADDYLCNWSPAVDFANEEDSIILYKVGDDAACNHPDDPAEGNWKASRIDADANDDPHDFPGDPTKPVYNEDGSLDGFLAVDDDNDLVFLDTDLQQQGVLTGANPTGLPTKVTFPGRPNPVIVDSQLCVYHHQDPGTAGDLECTGFYFEDNQHVHTGNRTGHEHARDGDILYFIDDDQLWRVDLAADNPAPESKFGPVDVPLSIADLYRVTATSDHVAWTFPLDTDGNTFADETRIVTLDRNDNYSVVVDETYNTPLPMNGPPILRRAGDWIFYNTADDKAVARRVDGSDVEVIEDAMWIGLTLNPLATEPGDSLDTVFLLTDVTSMTEHAGATLKAVSPDDPDTTVTLGTFDQDVRTVSMAHSPLGVGSHRLLSVTSGDPSDPDQDVYFIDPENPDSLTRVTTGGFHMPVMSH